MLSAVDSFVTLRLSGGIDDDDDDSEQSTPHQECVAHMDLKVASQLPVIVTFGDPHKYKLGYHGCTVTLGQNNQNVSLGSNSLSAIRDG